MVVDVCALSHPIAACFAIRALDYKLVQHSLDNLGHGPYVFVALYLGAAGRTCLAAVGLRCPGMIKTLSTEVVLAGELDGLIEGRVADQADEVAVWGGRVFEGLELGRDFDDSALSTLR